MKNYCFIISREHLKISMTQWANRAWWGPLCWNEAQMRPRRPVQTEYLYLFLYLYLNIYLYLYLGGTILFKWGANEAETSSPVLAVVSSAPPKCGSPLTSLTTRVTMEKEEKKSEPVKDKDHKWRNRNHHQSPQKNKEKKSEIAKDKDHELRNRQNERICATQSKLFF